MAKSISINALRSLKQLHPSAITCTREISTASSPSSSILKQSSLLSNRILPRHPSLLSSVRHFRGSRDPSTMHEIPPPINWGIRIVPEQKAYVVERFGRYMRRSRLEFTFLFRLLIELLTCILSRKRRFRFLTNLPSPKTMSAS